MPELTADVSAMNREAKQLAGGLAGLAACVAFTVWQPDQLEWIVLPTVASAFTAYEAAHQIVRRRRSGTQDAPDP
ncbi:MAG: hypothetical protein JWL73_1091 [Actinomycetia bacterium]|nr:hypothetical protein [Actinomycetes bacterium]